MEEIISEETYFARADSRAQYVAAAHAAYAAIDAARAAKAAHIARLDAAWAAACAAEGLAAEPPIHRLDPDIARTDLRVSAGPPYIRPSHLAEEQVLLAMRGCDELADMAQLAPVPGHEFPSLARDAATSWRYVSDVAASGYPGAYAHRFRPWAAIVAAADAAAQTADAWAEACAEIPK